MSEAKREGEGVIACDLSVFTPEEREQHLALCNALFATVREVRDLPDGYAIRLPGESSTLISVAQFIDGERRCCPFETFIVQVEPYGGAIWLHLTGPEGYREAVVADLSRLLNPEVAEAAGLR
jgi:hypothetical protein